MRKVRVIGICLLLLIGLVAALAITRPPSWRAILYEELFDACRDASTARARIWLLLGASPDGESDYEAAGSGRIGLEFSPPIAAALYCNDTRLLSLLLTKGASPNLGWSDSGPLSTAVHEHNLDAVKILLHAGANPRYSDRWTAVDQAKSLKFFDLVPVIEPYLKKYEEAQQDVHGNTH
jgi:ankyrin repeat protein